MTATPTGTLHCPRCSADVDVSRPWRGWKTAWILWRVLFVVALCLSPMLAADYCVMLPSFMVFLTAGGPTYARAKVRPACRRCLLELDEAPPSKGAAPPTREAPPTPK